MKTKLRIAVNDVFGYGSVSRTFCEDHKFDADAFALEEGWFCHSGVLSFSFSRLPDTLRLEFGQRPDKKTMSRLIREHKIEQKRLQQIAEQENGQNKPESHN